MTMTLSEIDMAYGMTASMQLSTASNRENAFEEINSKNESKKLNSFAIIGDLPSKK
jgi:hypothetical protein